MKRFGRLMVLASLAASLWAGPAFAYERAGSDVRPGTVHQERTWSGHRGPMFASRHGEHGRAVTVVHRRHRRPHHHRHQVHHPYHHGR